MKTIPENIREVLGQVRLSAEKANRNPENIKVVAVTKTVPVEVIGLAVNAGLRVLGENRVQELVEKYPLIDGVEWHIIGHLQTNKVKYITDKVTLLHSLDSFALAEEVSKRMKALGQSMDVLVQVNVAQEPTKFGIRPDETPALIEKVSRLPGLKIKGLMTIAPYCANPDETRPVFRKLKQIFEETKKMDFPGVEMKHLSMGMSNDYTVAIEEGATLVRIGSRIFGSRN